MLFNWTFIFNHLLETENYTTSLSPALFFHLPGTVSQQYRKYTQSYVSDVVTNIWIHNLWHPVVKGTQLSWQLWKLSQRHHRLVPSVPPLQLQSKSCQLQGEKVKYSPLRNGGFFWKVKSSFLLFFVCQQDTQGFSGTSGDCDEFLKTHGCMSHMWDLG